MQCVWLLLLLSSPLCVSSSAPPSLLHLLGLADRAQHLLGGQPEPSEQEEVLEVQRQSREQSPISIDLTFHLLRNMIHMAKVESQREQALVNRRVLDEAGK
ncbi:unnamed protein product [Knipowitschia caucasica]|uniref:Corticotropin-releasing factor domain-containing protein n=1 Tax=Knipowitschia caucasica TaxID=637954 RepID=A0AAV2K995_KNICA